MAVSDREEPKEPAAVSCLDELRELLGEVLGLGKRTATLNAQTPLFGSLPELDSMALVMVIIAIEERLDIVFEDEEVTAEAFETVGTLANLVDGKRS